jgi:hypothetical protein
VEREGAPPRPGLVSPVDVERLDVMESTLVRHVSGIGRLHHVITLRIGRRRLLIEGEVVQSRLIKMLNYEQGC